jgi:hypothetical protein
MAEKIEKDQRENFVKFEKGDNTNTLKEIIESQLSFS